MPPSAPCAAINTDGPPRGFGSKDYQGKSNICEPERLVVVVVVFDAICQAECQMSTNAEDQVCRSPRWRRTLHHRELRKTGAQLRDNPEEREKWPGRPKNPFIAAITATAESCVLVSVEPPKPTSHRHMIACRNKVQTFKYELRRVV